MIRVLCRALVATPILCALLTLQAVADGGGSAPPNFVPELSLSYVDPLSGERISCAEECRRFTVPAWVELEVRVKVANAAGNPWPDGVAWDLWFDQPLHPFPGIDLADCRDAENGTMDLACWQGLTARIDWATWKELVADRVCVPEDPDACRDVTITVPMDPGFAGSRGRGVYSFAAWVDRFGATVENNEFDNFAGPVRVRVQEPAGPDSGVPSAGGNGGGGGVVAASSPKPYSVNVFPAHAETTFSLSSMRSSASLEFSPAYNGEVSVRVRVTEAPEKIEVEVRKISTGAVLARGTGRVQVQLDGVLGGGELKDDRRLEVVVSLAQGSRGSRGIIEVDYPGRAVYRRTE
ncbi:MAG: hypothetical protein P8Y93_07375 [Acidobacteriota bacterium]